MRQRFTLVSILGLLGILVFAASASALTWETYLEDISTPSGSVDIDIIYWFNTTGASANYTNISLPCNVANLSQTLTNFTIYNTGTAATNNATYNLTVNGVAVVESGWSNCSVENVTTLATMVTAGVTGTDKYINFTFDCNQTTNKIGVNITASDAELSSTWISTYVAVAETILTAPEIDDHQAFSFFSVKDRAVVTNSLSVIRRNETASGYTITDISLNVTYPSHNLSDPDSSINITTLATSGVSYNNISYQKYGPYVTGTIGEDIDGDDHMVTIRVSSHEVLTRLVDWDFDETDDDYDDYFATLDFDTLVVKLNNVAIGWDEGTIEMDDDTLIEGTNNYKFYWTEEAAVAPTPVPGAWDWLSEEYGTGLAVWLWIVIIVVIVCIVIAVVYAKKK